jgi:SAM-dependent methyltransferase
MGVQRASPSHRQPRYDRIGRGYARTRGEDPEIRQRIFAALGSARTVVNVGAGAGSYEPSDRYVIAIEPSDVMADQRPPDRVPAIRATADDLPLRDKSVDAAMAILSLHHWDEGLDHGICELRRVARGPVVILTYDTAVSSRMWLIADYMPEVAELDRRTFPPLGGIVELLGGDTHVEQIELSRTTPDWMLGSFWAHPERVLDPAARQGTSGFARMPAEAAQRVIAAVEEDLRSGAWERRYGHLRSLERFDVGLRLIVNLPR